MSQKKSAKAVKTFGKTVCRFEHQSLPPLVDEESWVRDDNNSPRGPM